MRGIYQGIMIGVLSIQKHLKIPACKFPWAPGLNADLQRVGEDCIIFLILQMKQTQSVTEGWGIK